MFSLSDQITDKQSPRPHLQQESNLSDRSIGLMGFIILLVLSIENNLFKPLYIGILDPSVGMS